jgi:UDP-glucose 4-epimerase
MSTRATVHFGDRRTGLQSCTEEEASMRFERVLVTGGAGFVGRRLVREFVERSVETAVVDNLFVATHMPSGAPILRTYETDIRDRAAIDRVCREFRPDVIIHLAAIHHIPTCERNPHLAMDINVVGTQTLLDAAAKHRVGHFVLASSAAVYDWSDSALIEDETPLKATDVYSTGKLANEHQVADWAAGTGGKVAIARIFNLIGHDDPNSHLVPEVLAQLTIENGCVKTPRVRLGNTLPKRDYTHADDGARGVLAILDHMENGRQVEAYNIARGEERSVVEIVEMIGRHFQCEIEIVFDQARVRPVDRLHLLGDPNKSHDLLHWRARYGLEESLRDILTQLVPSTV